MTVGKSSIIKIYIVSGHLTNICPSAGMFVYRIDCTTYCMEWYETVQDIMYVLCLWCYSECASTPGKLKSLPDHSGNRTRDLWVTSTRFELINSELSLVPSISMYSKIAIFSVCVELSLVPSISMYSKIAIFSVCVGVIYSGEYYVCDGILSWLVWSQRLRVWFPPWSGKLFSLPIVGAHSE
jgi:hypothetical protein